MIQKIYIMTKSQKVLKTKNFKKIIEKNDDVKMRLYIRVILVNLNFFANQTGRCPDPNLGRDPLFANPGSNSHNLYLQ